MRRAAWMSVVLWLAGGGPAFAAGDVAPTVSDATPSESKERAAVADVTEDEFETQVVKAPIPVLVHFWAPWAGPSKELKPTLRELAEEFEGRLSIVQINADEAGALAAKYGVRAAPTLILFKQGEAVDTIVGKVGKDQLRARLSPHVS